MARAWKVNPSGSGVPGNALARVARDATMQRGTCLQSEPSMKCCCGRNELGGLELADTQQEAANNCPEAQSCLQETARCVRTLLPPARAIAGPGRMGWPRYCMPSEWWFMHVPTCAPEVL